VTAPPPRERTRLGALGPFAHRLFLVLFVAQLVSNIGTWMQSVGAVWLMGDLGGSPLLIASVQTASTLPVFVVGIFAGSLADIFDRRRLLLVTQTWMLLAAGVLAALTAEGATRPCPCSPARSPSGSAPPLTRRLGRRSNPRWCQPSSSPKRSPWDRRV
jgi:MFS family permease